MAVHPRRAVVISRRWHHPEITVELTREGISVAMSLEAFVEALAEEAGSPATLVRRASLRERIRTAALAVLEGMKESTAAVM